MKRLYLIRHAKSSWKKKDLADFDRPLNKRGKHDAPLMGTRLKKINLNPDVLISSPARRALSTAKFISDKINYPAKKIIEQIQLYLAEVPELLDIVRNLDGTINDAVMVGHNPGMTDFTNFLTDEDIENIPTCGVVCIELLIEEWKYVDQSLGTLLFFDYPKKHY